MSIFIVINNNYSEFKKIAINSFICFFIFSAPKVFSQGFINNGAKIVFSGAAQVYISGGTSGDFESKAEGTITPSSTSQITLEGDWKNNNPLSTAVFTANNGIVNFVGSAAQTINSSNTSSEVFNKIKINKSSASGTLTLNRTTEIVTNTDFTLGLINSSSSNLFIFRNGASESNASSNSYVVGPVRKIGNSAFTFPIGKGGYFAAAGISAPSLTTDHFTAEYFSADPNTVPYTRSSKESSINNVSACEYWIINKTNGTSSVSVDLTWGSPRSCTINNISELLVARWSGTQWESQGNAARTGTNSSGNITSTNVSAFNSTTPFTLSSSTNNNPLPIDLKEFTAICNEKQITISWTTIAENNNDYFALEKSFDGSAYFEIAQIDGAGNSTQINNYFYSNEASNATAYYRLKQTDFNGNTTYFGPVSINCDQTTHDVILLPNPNHGLFTIKGLQQNQKIVITDMLGKTIFKSKTTQENLEIELGDLATGVYNLQVIDAQLIISKKLIIE
jgi:hypothetical protein